MSLSHRMTYRLNDVGKANLLKFCDLTGMKSGEVAKAAITQFIAQTVMPDDVVNDTKTPPKRQFPISTMPKTTSETPPKRHQNDNDATQPRAQEKLNHKYNTEDKKETNKEKRSFLKKPVSSSKTSPSKTSTDSVTIPDTLDCPEFRQAWTDFMDHRKEIKKPITDRAKRMTLKRLSNGTVKDAIDAIEASIANGWQGLDPSWTKNRNNFHESNRIQGPANDPNYYDDPV